ncbi:hypothetical protein [Microbulbifer sp. Q7]|uniref:hypothetical protein n=1 Tax=Microbulbifer sp. Q7 TaxID=1785091 RepID=UPI00083653AB|nr:hypothetical protein [Microbulbifer sp. Q7]
MKILTILLMCFGVSCPVWATEDLPCEVTSTDEVKKDMMVVKNEIIAFELKYGRYPSEEMFWEMLRRFRTEGMNLNGNVWIQERDDLFQDDTKVIYSCALEKKRCQMAKSFQCETLLDVGAEIKCETIDHELFKINCSQS